MYDSEEDSEKGEMSSYYNVSEIFCCSYAPYFGEGIKIRYPEYTSYDRNNLRIESNIEKLYEETERKVGNIDNAQKELEKIMDSLYKEKVQQRRKRHKEDEYDEQF